MTTNASNIKNNEMIMMMMLVTIIIIVGVLIHVVILRLTLDMLMTMDMLMIGLMVTDNENGFALALGFLSPPPSASYAKSFRPMFNTRAPTIHVYMQDCTQPSKHAGPSCTLL